MPFIDGIMDGLRGWIDARGRARGLFWALALWVGGLVGFLALGMVAKLFVYILKITLN